MMQPLFIMIRTFNNIPVMRIFAGIILLLTITACNQQQQQPVNAEKKAEQPDSVKAFVLGMDSAKKLISLPGELLPKENAEIRAKTQGYIRKLTVDIGST